MVRENSFERAKFLWKEAQINQGYLVAVFSIPSLSIIKYLHSELGISSAILCHVHAEVTFSPPDNYPLCGCVREKCSWHAGRNSDIPTTTIVTMSSDEEDIVYHGTVSNHFLNRTASDLQTAASTGSREPNDNKADHHSNDGSEEFSDSSDTVSEASDTAQEYQDGSTNAIYRDRRYAPAIYVSEDKSEVYFAVTKDLQKNRWSPWERKFILVGVKFVDFADGQKKVGWCNSTECAQHDQHVRSIFEQTHHSQESQSEYSSRQLTCEWSSKLTQTWGGFDSLKHILQKAKSSPAHGVLEINLELYHPRHELQAKAVRAGNSFDDWSVVIKHLSNDQWFCTSCKPPHGCKHRRAVGMAREHRCTWWDRVDIRSSISTFFLLSPDWYPFSLSSSSSSSSPSLLLIISVMKLCCFRCRSRNGTVMRDPFPEWLSMIMRRKLTDSSKHQLWLPQYLFGINASIDNQIYGSKTYLYEHLLSLASAGNSIFKC